MIKIRKFFTMIIFISIIFLLTKNIDVIFSSVKISTSMFFYKVFPPLFIFFVLNDFLINYNISSYISRIFSKLFSILFNISESSCYVVILSLFSGNPSNSKYISSLLDNKIINIDEATKILSFTFFPSFMFVIGTIGYLGFNSTSKGLKIYLVVILSNLLLGIIIRNSSKKTYNKNNNLYIKTSFGKCLKQSILSSFSTLFIILGSIVIFYTLSNIIFKYISFSPVVSSIISSCLEMTQGINKILDINILEKKKMLLIIFSLMFGGTSIFSQVASIMGEYNINYKVVFKNRLIAVIIGIILGIIVF
ncbi:MAG: hypothetical protein RSB41_03645 [Bacilli bacterium]